MIESGTLTSTKGPACATLEQRFAELLGAKHVIACSSGTAAVHCAIAAIDPEPGDEIVTTPITDMGAITPILYQGAIPVFADVDPLTCNVTAETIAARLSDRTKAIIVTHLFGNPCDMGPIIELARARGIPVIEDCAQAYLAREGGKLVGTHGAIGCFSLQQGKHITTGEGGLCVTNDADLARRMRLFVNKAWGYGDPNPDHYFLALNYRMTELQGAVALAQLDKLVWGVEQRRTMAAGLSEQIEGLAGHHDTALRAGCGAHLLAVLPVGGREGGPGRLARAGRRPEATGHRRGPALHPEAGLPVRGLPRSTDVRQQPLPVHAGGTGGRRLLARAASRASSSACATFWCCPGTSASPSSTSTSSRRPCGRSMPARGGTADHGRSD